MKKIQWRKGLSLTQLAKEATGSESNFDYILNINGINPFEDSIKVGSVLDIPNLEDIKKQFPNTDKLTSLLNSLSLDSVVDAGLNSVLGKTPSGSGKIIDFFVGGLEELQ